MDSHFSDEEKKEIMDLMVDGQVKAHQAIEKLHKKGDNSVKEVGEFNLGDEVRHKVFGLKMVITQFEGGRVICRWAGYFKDMHDCMSFAKDSFDISEIEKVNGPK